MSVWLITGGAGLIGGSDEQSNRDAIARNPAAVDAQFGQPFGTTARLVTPVRDRLEYDRRYAMDASWVRREFDWIPRHELRAALPELVSWYDAHRDWADEI